MGVVGVPNAAAIAALGLHALQHRGQEATGVVACDERGEFTARQHVVPDRQLLVDHLLDVFRFLKPPALFPVTRPARQTGPFGSWAGTVLTVAMTALEVSDRQSVQSAPRKPARSCRRNPARSCRENRLPDAARAHARARAKPARGNPRRRKGRRH